MELPPWNMCFFSACFSVFLFGSRCLNGELLTSTSCSLLNWKNRLNKCLINFNLMNHGTDRKVINNCSNIKYEVSRKKARVFMICQVHWRRFKFQISRVKFEVQSLTVLDPCWQNRQKKLFQKCPRPFFDDFKFYIFFPKKGRNSRPAPWGRVSDSRCLNGEFFYITV